MSRRKTKFIMFPREWRYQLAQVKADGCAYRVALYLLWESWRTGSNRVKLPNGILEAEGVGRRGKRTALQLRRTGLIAVEQRPRKSPVVTVRFTD